MSCGPGQGAASITFDGKRIDKMHSNDIVDLGLSHIPESRKLFTDMSIRENLEMGAYPRRSWKQRKQTMEEVFELFPRLKERANQLSRTLSGGEQQMLAMGRGLMSRPRMVLVDEPSNGLAPKVVSEVFEILQVHAEDGHHHPARRAERPPDTADRRPGLRARERAPCPRGSLLVAARERPRAEGVPGPLAVPHFGASIHLVAQRPLPRERPFDTLFAPKV